MDASNPVVALCAQGMSLEGTPAAARECFERAWAMRRDDYESSIAAHFLARHQPSADLCLEWNERALAHAEASSAPEARLLLPSLLLNLGDSQWATDDRVRARRTAIRARDCLEVLPADGYRQFVGGGIERLLSRAAGEPESVNSREHG